MDGACDNPSTHHRDVAYNISKDISICQCAGILDKDLYETGCWWSVIAVMLNFLTIGLQVFLTKRNGQTYWQLINYQKSKTTWKQIVGVTFLELGVGMCGR